MTFAQINYILAVERYRNFVQAAESCHVTQPALSMQIQKLETELGIKIFDRSQNPIEATAIGRKVIEQAKKTFSEFNRIKLVVANERNECEGEIRLGVIPTLAPYLLPLFLENFVNEYPKIQLSIRELTTDAMILALRNDELDLGIMATPAYQEDLHERVLFYEELLLYVSPKSEVFLKSVAYTDDINPEHLWLLEEGHCLRSQIEKLCSLRKKVNSVDFKAGSLETLIRLVDRYEGMTVLPELAILDFSEMRANKVRRFVSPRPVREVSLVFQKDYPRKIIIDALHEIISKSVGSFVNQTTDRTVLSIH